MSEKLIPLLPLTLPPATTLLVSDKLPCHGAKISNMPIAQVLNMLNREHWVEGLYVNKNDFDRIKRYKNQNGQYKNDFDEKQFLSWIKILEENTAICDMENTRVGKGIFVPPAKRLPQGTFIPSSGIIKLDPTTEEFETKNHCSALQNFNSPEKIIYGIIDPQIKGGMLDLINHAPDNDELVNFKFKNASLKQNVAIANLKGKIKFYQGYAIMGVEVTQNLEGGKYGKQLLWSYAKPDEYFSSQFKDSTLFLFDNRNEHNGEILSAHNYSLTNIDIFIDTGKMVPQKIATFTRWELMENDPESTFTCSIEDRNFPISYGFLQTYLKKKPAADRVILNISPR